MRKDEMTTMDLLLEAIGVVSGLIYIGMQIYYGVTYGVNVVQLMLNLLVFVLMHAGLTLLQVYPERVNNLSLEICQGKIRRYTVTMIRLIKLIFILCLLFTSICDVMGIEMEAAYSLIVVGLIIVIALIFEIKIIKLLKQNRVK